jgi:hypothetical protein
MTAAVKNSDHQRPIIREQIENTERKSMHQGTPGSTMYRRVHERPVSDWREGG